MACMPPDVPPASGIRPSPETEIDQHRERGALFILLLSLFETIIESSYIITSSNSSSFVWCSIQASP